MSSMKFKCQHHATLELSLVCIVCNNKPICDLCKILHHKGHIVRAIASGSQTQEQRELDKQIQKAKGNLERHRERLSDFERSVSLAEDLLTKRGQVLTTWVQEYVRKKIALVQLIAEEGGRRDISVSIREAEKVLKVLEARAALFSVGNSGRRESVGTELQALLPEADLPAVENEVRDFPKCAPHIFIPDSHLVQWKPCVEEFISNPLGAQTSEVSRKSDLAVVLKLTCSTNPKARVLGLRVVGYEDVIVVLTTDDPTKALLKIISKDMNKVYAEEIGVTYPCKIFLSAGKLLLVSALTGAVSEIDSAAVSRFLFQYTQIADSVEDCVLTFNKRITSRNAKDKKKATPGSKHQKLRKIYEVIGDASRPAFSVHVKNPRTPVSDPSGKFIAIIQDAEEGYASTEAASHSPVVSSDSADQIIERLEGRVNSEDDSGDDLLLSTYEVTDGAFSSVSVYRVPEPGAKAGSKAPESLEFVCQPMARGTLKARDSQLSDACFYRLGLKQELGLVVADPGHDVLLVARQLSEGGEEGGVEGESLAKCPMLSPLVADCSLLEAPTVLTADLKGRLWIGCQGGKILMLVPKEEVSEGYINYCIRELEQTENALVTPARTSDGDEANLTLLKYKHKPRVEPAPRDDRAKPENAAEAAQCQYVNFQMQDPTSVYAMTTGGDASSSRQSSDNHSPYAVPLRLSRGVKPEDRKVQSYVSMRLIHPVRPLSGRLSDGAHLTTPDVSPSLPSRDVAGQSPSLTPSVTVQRLPAKPVEDTPGSRTGEPIVPAFSRNKFSRINLHASRLSTSSIASSTSSSFSSSTSTSSSSSSSSSGTAKPNSLADEGQVSSSRRSTSESKIEDLL